MFYDFAVTVPAGTAERSPYVKALKLTAGLIIRVDVEFPAGCRGYVSAVVMVGGHQLYPTNPEGAINAEDFTVSAWDFYPLLKGPYELRCYAWSPDANYQHTITVRVDLVRLEDLLELLPFVKGLEKLLEYMGVPVTEEAVPTAPPPPPKAPPGPPICSIGAKKCIGADLYECQEVEGVADWVMIEESSPHCQAVQPPPKEEKPEPEPEPSPEPELVPSPGEIQSITWVMGGVEHPLTDPIPHHADYYHRFKIKNTGDHKADYRVAYYRTGYGEGYKFTRKITLEPGQVGYIDHPYWAGAMPGEYTVTWHLFSYNEDVDQVEATHIIGEEATE